MHQERDRQVHEEIKQGRGVILDYQNFEGRYGKKNSSIYFNLQNIYTDYEAGVQAIFAGTRRASSALQYKTEEWFLGHLAGQTLAADETDIPAEAVTGLKLLLTKLFTDHQETADAFRTMVYEYVSKKFFSKKKSQMEGIVTNMLDLLAWLKQKGVGMRDLKPDNLIVTGDPETNPNFAPRPRRRFPTAILKIDDASLIKPPSPF